MSKKYLSVEEAAELLGVNTSEVLRAREQDKIRGFADRGTWKFKAEDVENYRRTLGSDFDSPLGTDVLDDDDVLSEQPTVIRKGEASSDSDVRLIYSGAGSVDSQATDSDSDVRLAGNSDKSLNQSIMDSTDSDVKLVGGDRSVSASEDRSVSEVQLAPLDSGEVLATSGSKLRIPSDSDSDVKLVGKASSGEIPEAKSGMLRQAQAKPGSGVKAGSGIKPSSTIKTTTDIKAAAKATADDTIDFTPDEASVLDDSGISLVGDSGISLDRPADSGISLERVDSGISLSSDSALNLAHDSGISLDITSDSGISLSESMEEFEKKDKKGAKGKKGPRSDDDLRTTNPMMDIPLAGEGSSTNMEIPLLDEEEEKDSSYDLADSADNTSVITLDEDSGDEFAETVVRKPSKKRESAFEEAVFDESEDVEVAAETGEDDELEEMDVFGAADEDFDDSFQSGESQGDMEIPTRAAAAPVEHEWGAGVFVSLCLTGLLMLACGTVAYDLVQNLWHADVQNRGFVPGLVLNMLGPLFGG